jgi:prepilin-type N-terminal cleavage/methylation domain-containing protein
MRKRAFTLIELLVVIAIIAILAAILFPVFTKAKTAAKKSAEISQMKQIGIALQIYMTDYDDVYPQAYYYPNDNGSAPIGGVGGYVQWTYLLEPYSKNKAIFVSPGDPTRGLAPTNFVGNNDGCGVPAGQVTQFPIQDLQICRVSYTANAMLMPRKRRSVDPMTTISQTAVEEIAQIIAIGPQSHYPTCINGTSTASGTSFKTHRPSNGILVNDGSGPLNALRFQGEDPVEVGNPTYYAITFERAVSDLAACKGGIPAGAGGFSHITYSQPDRWDNGANYVFGDTHAKFSSLSATVNPNNFMWGKRAYTAGGGLVVRADGVTPVN